MIKKHLSILSIFMTLLIGAPGLATELPDVSGAGSLTDNATTQGQQKTNFSKLRNSIAEIPGGTADVEVTIAAGVITPPAAAAVLRCDTESDSAADDLTAIAITNVRDGAHVELRLENSARIVTLKNGTGANLIATNTGGDIVLRDGMRVTMEFDAGLGSGQWRVIGIFPGGDSTALSNYRTYLGLGNAATKTTGTSSGNVPLVSDADTLYAGIKRTPGAEAPSELTLSSDSVTPTKSHHTIDTEGDASTDNLATVVTTNIPDGGLLLLRADNTARDVVVKHGTGNIFLFNSADFTLDNTEKSLILRRNGSNWYEVVRGGVTSAASGIPIGGNGTRQCPTSGSISGVYYHHGDLTTTGAWTIADGTRIYCDGTITINHAPTLTRPNNGGRSSIVSYAACSLASGPGAGSPPMDYKYRSSGGGGAFGGDGGNGGGYYSGAFGYGGKAYDIRQHFRSSGGSSTFGESTSYPAGVGGNGGNCCYLEAAVSIVFNANWTATGQDGTAGTSTYGSGGAGGSGGGVVAVAGTSITVNTSMTISVAGGSGGNAGSSSGGPGPAGGGGWIILHAPTVTNNGTLTVTKGSIASTGSTTQACTAAGDGQSVTIQDGAVRYFILAPMLEVKPVNLIPFKKKAGKKCA